MKTIIATALRKLRAGGPQRPLEIGCGEFLSLVGFDADALDPVRAEELAAEYTHQPAVHQALVVLSESGNGGIVRLGCGDVINALGSDADELFKTLKPMPAQPRARRTRHVCQPRRGRLRAGQPGSARCRVVS